MSLEPPASGDPADDVVSSPEEKLLSRGEAARYLGVPVSTVYQWARTGRLSYKVTLGGHLRFSKADLDVAKAARAPRQSRLTQHSGPADPPSRFGASRD
jgi:excisionase family DNA binding protein